MYLKSKDEKKQRKPANSKRKAYLLTLGSFITAIFVLCISPVFSGANYKYEELKIGEYRTLTNGVQVAIAKKEYNPTNQTLRIDYSLKAEGDSQVLSNLKYTVENKYIKQEKDDVKTTVYRASDDYIVVISENIPEDFGVVSSTIKPEYIHPEIEYDPNDLKDIEFKTYILEKDKMKNESLERESKSSYEQEYIELQKTSLSKEIKQIEKEIAEKKEANKQLEIKNDTLTDDMTYQTEEEKTKTQNSINANVSLINNNEKDIEVLEKDKKVKQDKIDLLNEKKNTVTKSTK